VLRACADAISRSLVSLMPPARRRVLAICSGTILADIKLPSAGQLPKVEAADSTMATCLARSLRLLRWQRLISTPNPTC